VSQIITEGIWSVCSSSAVKLYVSMEQMKQNERMFFTVTLGGMVLFVYSRPSQAFQSGEMRDDAESGAVSLKG
jgi:hypothetical protein